MKDRSTGKLRKQYVYRSKSESKTCLIHGRGHSSDECNVLGDCGAKYVNGNPIRYHNNNHIPREKINRQLENNAIINNVVDEILLKKHKN